MPFLRVAFITLLAGGTIWATAATIRKSGIPNVRHPQGISLREDSLQGRRAGVFPGMMRTRTHRGGGLRSGK
ncbi:MAG: hypothetical protein PVF59_08000 [Desulfobacterales bacterium]|jgi:hypothetical protein